MSLSFMSGFPNRSSTNQKPRGHQFSGVDFVPQAIISVDISYFATYFEMALEALHDDLDSFKGFSFFDDVLKAPVAVRHYAGHPAGTVTVYFPREIADVEVITFAIRRLLNRFKLSQDALFWERRDDPDL